MLKRRRQYSAAFKFRDALEALGGRKTVIQFSSELEVHAKLIPAKKPRLLKEWKGVYASSGAMRTDQP